MPEGQLKGVRWAGGGAYHYLHTNLRTLDLWCMHACTHELTSWVSRLLLMGLSNWVSGYFHIHSQDDDSDIGTQSRIMPKGIGKQRISTETKR